MLMLILMHAYSHIIIIVQERLKIQEARNTLERLAHQFRYVVC